MNIEQASDHLRWNNFGKKIIKVFELFIFCLFTLLSVATKRNKMANILSADNAVDDINCYRDKLLRIQDEETKRKW